MAVVEIEIKELIPYLKEVGNFKSEEELAKALNISNVTKSKWKRGNVEINSKSENKLRDAMSKNKNWGLQLGKVKGTRIEIIQKAGKDNDDQTDIVYELLIKEIKMLREELAKYKSKKK